MKFKEQPVNITGLFICEVTVYSTAVQPKSDVLVLVGMKLLTAVLLLVYITMEGRGVFVLLLMFDSHV